MAISIDTQVLIWGVKRVATANRQHMIPRAEALIERCREDRTKIIIPAQALAEYLVGFEPEVMQQSLALINKYFFVAPLDAKAAVVVAELLHAKTMIEDIRSQFSLSRQHVKADANVIAISVAAGATHLYCEDGHMSKLAQGRIIVRQLPESPDSNLELFG